MSNAERAALQATALMNAWLQETRGLPVTLQLTKLGLRIAEALTAAYSSAGITFICEWCGELQSDPNIIEIDSGTILTCPKCRGETVIDLNGRQQRSAWYKTALWASRKPRQALKILSDPNQILCSACAALGHARPECAGCTAAIQCAQVTVAKWLNELE